MFLIVQIIREQEESSQVRQSESQTTDGNVDSVNVGSVNGDTNGDGNDRNTCVVCLTRPRNGKYQRILMCKIVSEKDATDDNSKYVLVYHVDDIIFGH